MMTETGGPPIRGRISPGFERVRDVFVENFTDRDELGAACAVYHEGKPVVDLWGGYRDTAREKPWEKETLVPVFSATEGAAAMAVAHARSVGLFEYDETVARHWPAFRAHGKGGMTIRELLAHRGGLATLDRTLTPGDLRDRDELADVLAAQRPDWVPGTRQGYHAVTLGWYASELIRQADPYDRTLGAYFRQEIAEPYDLEFYIRMPTGVPEDRIAEIEPSGLGATVQNIRSIAWPTVKATMKPRSLTRRALNPLECPSPALLRSPAYRHVEIPSANGIGQIRHLARAYGELATAQPRLGIDRQTRDELERIPDAPAEGTVDAVLQTDITYSLGFWKPSLDFDFGSNSAAFGAPGASGSFAFADPEYELGVAYAPNRMGVHRYDDPRARALCDAVYSCLDRQ